MELDGRRVAIVNGPLRARASVGAWRFVWRPYERRAHSAPFPAGPGLAAGAPGAGREAAGLHRGGGPLLGAAEGAGGAEPVRADPGAGGDRRRRDPDALREPRDPGPPGG